MKKLNKIQVVHRFLKKHKDTWFYCNEISSLLGNKLTPTEVTHKLNDLKTKRMVSHSIKYVSHKGFKWKYRDHKAIDIPINIWQYDQEAINFKARNQRIKIRVNNEIQSRFR